MQTFYPYVISEAYPDYKRPYLYEYFGVVKKERLETFFVEKLSEFIVERYGEEQIESIEDIETFWNAYYDDSYMSNEPWQSMVFIDNEWINYTPTNEEIFNYIKNNSFTEDDKSNTEYDKNITEYDDTEDDKSDNEENDSKEQIVFKFTPEEIDIQNKIREYFEKELENNDKDKTIFKNMNNIDQLVFVLTTYILNISPEKYIENRELFLGFFNMILRIVENDIAETTNKLEIVYDKTESEKLNHIMNIYGSILEYKNFFKR